MIGDKFFIDFRQRRLHKRDEGFFRAYGLDYSICWCDSCHRIRTYHPLVRSLIGRIKFAWRNRWYVKEDSYQRHYNPARRWYFVWFNRRWNSATGIYLNKFLLKTK